MGKKKKLQKSLRICLSKIKKVPSQLSMQSSPAGRPAASASASATSWILSACKYPKTPSFAVDRDRHPDDDDDNDRGGVDPAATLSDVDRFLYENFNSLCSRRHDDDEEEEEEEEKEEATRPAAVFRSTERFLVSPGSSSSLHDEAGRRSTSTSPPSRSSQRTAEEVPGGGVAVTTFSKDPYEDFRRSMQEMVDARHGVAGAGQPLDWDFMEELLFCYLELNDRSVHKYILKAFTELAVAFRRQNNRRRAPPENNNNKAKMKYYSKKERMVEVRRRFPAAGD